MTDTLGLCVNVRNALPDRAELEALRPAAIRSILYSVADVGPLLNVLPDDVALDLVINNECQEVGPDWAGLEDALSMIARNYAGRVRFIEVGNELDTYWARNPNDVPPVFGANLIRRALPILQPAGILTVLASVGGPKWQDWLSQAIDACAVLPDGVAFHPYYQRPDGWQRPGWGFGDLRPAVINCHQIARRPVYVTEFGTKVSEAGSESEQASYLTAAAQTLTALGSSVCPVFDLFAWSDLVGTPEERGEHGFGLRREDGSQRPSWNAFCALSQQPAPAPAPRPQPAPPPPPDPEPEPMPQPDPAPALSALDEAYAALWRAALPDLVLNPDAAIYKAWRANYQEWGSPVSDEIPDTDGSVIQAFAVIGPMRWTGGNEVIRAA